MKLDPTLGNYCRSVALSSVVNYYGYSLSEAMCFGIGEAFDFCGSDIRFGRKRIYKCFAGNNENDIFRFSEQMKMKVEMYQPKNRKETRRQICDLIEQEKPVIARVSIDKYMRFLPGMATDNLETMKAVFRIIRGSVGNHVTIISNAGREKVMIHEPNLMSPVLLPWENLFRAMNPGNGLVRHPSNTLYVITPLVPAEEMETEEKMRPVIWNAIRNNMKNYLYNQSTWAGVRQVQVCGRTLLNMENKDKFAKNAVLFRFFCDIATGGGFYRRLYARFLREANDRYLKDDVIEGVSKKYFALSRRWSRLSGNVTAYAQEPDWSRSGELWQDWKEISRLEEELAGLLYKRSADR